MSKITKRAAHAFLRYEARTERIIQLAAEGRERIEEKKQKEVERAMMATLIEKRTGGKAWPRPLMGIDEPRSPTSSMPPSPATCWKRDAKLSRAVQRLSLCVDPVESVTKLPNGND